MLDDEIKKEIQSAYSEFLSNKDLKPRYGQKLMIADIARTLGNITLDEEGQRVSEQHLCVVEAGTGTGKTVAYLLASLPVAKALNKKIVLATATVALQEQIIVKDLPDLIRHSKLKFDFCLAKGRGRYLCLAKLDALLSDVDDSELIPLYADEQSVIDESDIKLYQTMMEDLSVGKWDGDRDNWEDEIGQASWQRVTTDHRQCTGRRCSHVRNCAFFKAREAINDVDCIVTNHDLVLADLALGGGAILPSPEESIYIFDEGHHLPDKALQHFANHTRYKSTLRWLGQSEGQWSNILAPLSDASYLVEVSAPLESILKETRALMESGLPHFDGLMHSIDRTQKSPRLQFPKGECPAKLEEIAKDLEEGYGELVQQLEKIHRELENLLEDDYAPVPKVDLENVFPVVGTWLSRAEANRALWMSYSNTELNQEWPIARWITLVEYNDIADYEVVSSPILASKTLEKDLWSRSCGAIVTSATLTALNTFDRFKYRAGTYDDACYSVVPSPFNYSENAEIVIPDNALEANNPELHTESVIDLLQEIVDLKAGTLVLFSSRRQMHDVYEELPSAFRNHILMQGAESKQELVKKHKKRINEQQGSVIFGLASFAEGVDLPGDYCTHVIIAKLPFSVPDDPLEAAMAEWIEAQGGNAFMQISVPDAAMRLVQSCGRLLRTETDKGKISILDRRLISKRYGKALLDSLPPFKRSF